MSLKSNFSPPGDKSISHRIALLSLLAGGRCRVENYSNAEDPATSIRAVNTLGGNIRPEATGFAIEGVEGKIEPKAEIDCGNSGTTIRFLMGILAGREGGEYTLFGDDSLNSRPMERVAGPLREMGADIRCGEGGKPPVKIFGKKLKWFEHTLKAPSAQLKSAILLAGLRADGTTRLYEPIVSRDHTEKLLAACGARISRFPGGWRVEPSVPVLPETLRVPGDASSAAFFLCGAAITKGSDLTAEGVILNPTRTGFLSVLERMGVDIAVEERGEIPEAWGSIRVRYSPSMTGCEVRGEEIPSLVDEVPVLALAATQAKGTTVFRDVGELRHKESDRLNAVVTQLGALGAEVYTEKDDLIVEGPTPLKGKGPFKSFGDHRIAMTLKVAGLPSGEELTVEDESCIDISYPDFPSTLRSLIR